MALTGLQINKLLPATNCKECGSNTCLAFAMKLAARKADLAECPYASDEAKRVLGEATEPPVRAVALGPGGKMVTGEETVLYRHEKTFVRPTLIAININDADDEAAINETIGRIRDYRFERVGETFQVDLAALSGGSDPGTLCGAGRENMEGDRKAPRAPVRKRGCSEAGFKKLLRDRGVSFARPTPLPRTNCFAVAKEDDHSLALIGRLAG